MFYAALCGRMEIYMPKNIENTDNPVKTVSAKESAKTSPMKERAKEAEGCEKKKLAIKKEMEKIMAEYAAITGITSLAARKHPVGMAPNDWRHKEHRLNKK